MTVIRDSDARLLLRVTHKVIDSEGGPMIVIVDERQLVKEGYHSLFDREGVASAGFGSSEFGEWMTSAPDEDLNSVRAFLLGDCGPETTRRIRDRTAAPV